MLTDALRKLNSAGRGLPACPGEEFVPTIPLRDRSSDRDTWT